MAVGISDFNETEDFEEYNPHPYQGGYDIVLTYGSPLPPSSAICYAMSDASSHPPLPPKVSLPSVPVEPPASPEASERAISTSVGPEDGHPEADYGSSYGYGERGFASVDWWQNLSGFPPYMMNGIDGCRYDAEELRYWSRLRRAVDYIFGYSQGLGERRIGVDSYGIPIYAYKRHGEDPVHVEIEPARTEKFEFHGDSERWSSTYNNWEDENYKLGSSTHAYQKHHPEEPFDAEVDPVESVFSWKPSYHGHYDEQVPPERKLVPLSYGESRNEVNLYGNLEMAYDTHYYGGAQNVQLEAIESSFQKLSYHEASQEFSYTDSNWEPSYGIHGDERNAFNNAHYDYERRDYQQPSDVELEPYKPTWAQYPGYYGISEEDVYTGSQPEPSYGIHEDERNAFNNAHYDYERRDYQQPSDVELEPYKPTWAQYPGYYGISEEDFYTGSQPIQISDYSEVYNESSSPRSAWQTSSFGEWGNEGEFHSSENAYQTHHDDNSLELEPFKPTLMLNPNYYGSYEEISAPYKQQLTISYPLLSRHCCLSNPFY